MTGVRTLPLLLAYGEAAGQCAMPRQPCTTIGAPAEPLRAVSAALLQLPANRPLSRAEPRQSW